MSISVGFTTESKRENSTKQRTMSTTQNCLLKNGCSMLYPTLLLELDTDSFPTYTGFKIEDRYYNVTDIKSVRQNLFEISGEVDVLATYKTEIGSATEYIARAASANDPLIIDMKYPAKANSVVDKITLSQLNADSTGTYVLGIAGIGDEPSGVTYYAFNAYTFAEVMLALFDENYLDHTLADITVELQKELINPFQYIVSCYWYPIPYSYFTNSGTLATVYFGWWKAQYSAEGGLNTVVAIKIPETARLYSFVDAINPLRHPQAATRGTYLNDSPYTQITLNCYSFGQIPINPSPCTTTGSITVRIDVDVFTGVAELYIFYNAPANGSCIKMATSQYGVPIQINQNTANVISGFANAIPSAMSFFTRGSIAGAVNGIATALESKFPQIQTNGANGSKAAFVETPTLVFEFRIIAEEDNETMGRPLCDKRQINTLTGYIECSNVDISLASTAPERAEVVRFMESGFFYE